MSALFVSLGLVDWGCSCCVSHWFYSKVPYRMIGELNWAFSSMFRPFRLDKKLILAVRMFQQVLTAADQVLRGLVPAPQPAGAWDAKECLTMLQTGYSQERSRSRSQVLGLQFVSNFQKTTVERLANVTILRFCQSHWCIKIGLVAQVASAPRRSLRGCFGATRRGVKWSCRGQKMLLFLWRLDFSLFIFWNWEFWWTFYLCIQCSGELTVIKVIWMIFSKPRQRRSPRKL